MSTMNPTILFDPSRTIPDSEGKVDSWVWIAEAIERLLIGDWTRDGVDRTNTTLISIGTAFPGDPYTGEFFLRTDVSPYQLYVFDGVNWTPQGIFVDPDPPEDSGLVPVPGNQWYDSTNHLLRVYDTIDGITGWHPVDSGAQLWTNGGGSDLSGLSFVTNFPNAAFPRSCARVERPKDPNVIGIATEDIAQGESGLIIMVGSNLTTQLNVDAGFGTGAIGDLVGAAGGTSTGTGRLVGRPQDDNWGTNRLELGNPMGAAAEVLEPIAGPGTVALSVRLLPEVGKGRRLTFARRIIARFGETGGGADDFDDDTGLQRWMDLSDLPGGNASPILQSYHEPLVAVEIQAAIIGGADGSPDWWKGGLQLLDADGSIFHDCSEVSQPAPGLGFASQRVYNALLTRTYADDAGDKDPGQLFSYRLTAPEASTANPVYSGSTFLYVTGYYY